MTVLHSELGFLGSHQSKLKQYFVGLQFLMVNYSFIYLIFKIIKKYYDATSHLYAMGAEG